MSHYGEIGGVQIKVCESAYFHQSGRPPRAPYRIGDIYLCRPCLELLISQGPTQVGCNMIRLAAPDPHLCTRDHPWPVAAAAKHNDEPLCWPCIDAQLLRREPHHLTPLK